MNDSRIEISQGATSFVGADAVDLYRLKVLRSAISLHQKCGMIPTRGMTITRLLAQVTQITGKPYKGKTKHADAIAALDARTGALQASLPIINKN